MYSLDFFVVGHAFTPVKLHFHWTEQSSGWFLIVKSYCILGSTTFLKTCIILFDNSVTLLLSDWTIHLSNCHLIGSFTY